MSSLRKFFSLVGDHPDLESVTLNGYVLSDGNFWTLDIRLSDMLTDGFSRFERVPLLDDASAVAQSIITQNRRISRLDLKNNCIHDAYVACRRRVTSVSTRVNQHDFAVILLRGIAAIAHALVTNRSLTEVTLGHNKGGTQAAVAFADVIRRNSTLLHLDLRVNRFGRFTAWRPRN